MLRLAQQALAALLVIQTISPMLVVAPARAQEAPTATEAPVGVEETPAVDPALAAAAPEEATSSPADAETFAEPQGDLAETDAVAQDAAAAEAGAPDEATLESAPTDVDPPDTAPPAADEAPSGLADLPATSAVDAAAGPTPATATEAPTSASPAGEGEQVAAAAGPPSAAPSVPSGPDQAFQPAACANLQALVDAAPAGGTVSVPPCIYRQMVTISKPLTFAGQPGAEIRGSDVWNSGWAQAGSTWVSARTVPNLPFSASPMNEVVRQARAAWPEQVFVDGLELEQVDSSSAPGPGQFKLVNRGADRRVVLGSNPSGKLVEVTTRAAWIVVKASDVTVRGTVGSRFKMRHAGSNYQRGGIDVYGQDRFVLEDADLSYAHTANLALYHGVNHRISRVSSQRAGAVGIDLGANFYGAPVAGLIVEDSELAYNNTQGFNPGWHAGGLKATVRSDAVYRRNVVHDNAGPGLWADTRANNSQFYGNRVYRNAGPGIFFEVSDGAKIYDNILYENALGGGDNWGWQPSILASTSRNVEISGNVVAWSGDGISVVWQPMRGDKPAGDAAGIYVHDNTVVQTAGRDRFGIAWLQDRADGTLYSDASNRGQRNAYWFSAPESGTPRFSWTTNGTTFSHLAGLAAFNGTGGEQGGRYLSDPEMARILTMAGIPTAPEIQ